jgi:sulfite exporter TauE/SafE
MDEKILILSVSAASLGVLHTLVGPDHYLPFIVMSRARNWSHAKTAWITFLCGLGHVGSSVILGMIGVLFGFAFKDLLKIEDIRGGLAAWLLIVFGFAYMAWGVYRTGKDQAHRHYHLHPGGIAHAHLHTHGEGHGHVHKGEKAENLTPWVLFTIFALGPCEVLIPNLMYPAAEHNYQGVVAVAAVFSIATIATMMAVVLTLSFGIKKISLGFLEKYMHVLAGAAVFLSGCAIVFLDW